MSSWLLYDLFYVAIAILAIWLFFRVKTLSTRVNRLEQKLEAIRDSGSEQTAQEKKSTAAPVEQVTKSAPLPAARPLPEQSQPAKGKSSNTDRADKAGGTAPNQHSQPRSARTQTDYVSALISWFSTNWIYVVSALSLSLAGIFLIQYGVETGLLTQAHRIYAAIALGLGLIAGGEQLRRKRQNGQLLGLGFVPEVLAGSGIVCLFGAISGAHLLYNLISADTAFIGLVIICLCGVLLGWLFGAFLSAISLIGAYSAPFLLGSPGPAPAWLYIYFGAIAVLGLGIDTMRRWAWVSVLSLTGAFVVGMMIFDAALAGPFHIYGAALALMATAIPARSLFPDHSGQNIAHMLMTQEREMPNFPVWLSGLTLLTTCSLIWITQIPSSTEFWISIWVLSILSITFILWSKTAPALQDISALPALTLIAIIMQHAFQSGDVFAVYQGTFDTNEEADFPWAVTIFTLIFAAMSYLMGWRALQPNTSRLPWVIGAALYAPLGAALLYIFWAPQNTIGTYGWALHLMALAALLVMGALYFARLDPHGKLRPAVYIVAALTTIGFAFTTMLGFAELTLAFALLVVIAAWLGRKYTLPLMQLFISLAIVAITWRLIFVPGISWGLRTIFIEMLVAYGAPILAYLGAMQILRGRLRPGTRVMLETATWATGGILVSLTLSHIIDAYGGKNGEHAHFGLQSAIWLIMMLVQLRRADLPNLWLRTLRIILACVYALTAIGFLLIGFVFLTPLMTGWFGSKVAGLPVFNSLIPAYLLPSLLFFYAAWNARSNIMRAVFAIPAIFMTGFWGYLTIRHIWNGADNMPLSNGYLQGELYSYTIALMIVGVALFIFALARGNQMLRRAGLVVIGLAIAKVFFVDITELAGILRVVSFLVLGLSLAALAWLDRWASERVEKMTQ